MQKTSEVYKRIYHYTTLQGAVGILQSQSLWSTHSGFLNDTSERILIRDKLVEILYPQVLQKCQDVIKKFPRIADSINSEGGLAVIARKETETLIDVQYRVTGDEIYITSLCGETGDAYVDANGLLSQWRGYGRDGGIGIVFDTQKLEDILQIEANKFDYAHLSLCDLIYSHDDKKFEKELSQPLSELSDFILKLFWEVVTKEGTTPSAAKAYPAFVQCISRYKHRGFQEEKETRIIAIPAVQNDGYKMLAKEEKEELKPEKPRLFREKNGERIPYIELFKAEGSILPIERIIVGPHKEKESRASALRIMLRNTKIKVTTSEIPYIG